MNPRHPIQFRNCSENADEFEWDFGDGQFTFEREPEHAYSEPGTYEVKLTITEGNSRKFATKTINVQYAFIDSIKIVSISPTKPNGDPWDPDGSGADIRVIGRDCNQPPGASVFSTPRALNISPPHTFYFSGLNINFCALFLNVEDFNEPLITDFDTVGSTVRDYSEFADSPVERIVNPNVTYEFYMSHN